MKNLFSCGLRWVAHNYDKAVHFLVCFILAFVTATVLTMCCEFDGILAGLIGFMGASFIGLWKEYYDQQHEGSSDTMDILADAVGALCAMVVFDIIILCS